MNWKIKKSILLNAALKKIIGGDLVNDFVTARVESSMNTSIKNSALRKTKSQLK